MGGHGGLNILPQKKWHVFNYDNRFKVELDQLHAQEEEIERDETVKQLQTARVFNTLREQAEQPLRMTEDKKETQGNSHYIKEQQKRRDSEVMRSSMYLGQTVSHQSAPWYTVPHKSSVSYDFSAAKSEEFYSIVPKKSKHQKHHAKARPVLKPDAKPSIEELRTARLAREAAERKRTERLMQERDR
jgi:hypothetical protein